jgi:hypothetical protein
MSWLLILKIDNINFYKIKDKNNIKEYDTTT